MPSKYERRRLVVAFIGVVAFAYWVVVRPWHLRWGTTDEEADGTLPGDDLLRRPESQVTHAITIDAPVEDVWPWLVQIGQGRAGFYSYDFLENLVGANIHNADRIVPEYQDLDVGDIVRLAPEDYQVQTPESAPEVAILDPERAVVLQPPGESPRWTWAFVLHPMNDGTTRFVVRMRSHGTHTVGGRVADYLSDARTDEAVRIGAISGAIATIPMVLFGLFFLSAISSGGVPGGFAPFIVLIGVFSLFYTVGLSALGGYLGAHLTDEYGRD